MPLSPGDLAGCLLEVGAVRLQPMDPFTWASGLKSPIYCDNRQLLGFPALRSGIKATAESYFGIFADPIVAAAWGLPHSDQERWERITEKEMAQIDALSRIAARF